MDATYDCWSARKCWRISELRAARHAREQHAKIHKVLRQWPAGVRHREKERANRKRVDDVPLQVQENRYIGRLQEVEGEALEEAVCGGVAVSSCTGLLCVWKDGFCSVSYQVHPRICLGAKVYRVVVRLRQKLVLFPKVGRRRSGVTTLKMELYVVLLREKLQHRKEMLTQSRRFAANIDSKTN